MRVHPRVSATMTGVCNKRPPQSKYFLIWDAKNVLDYFRKIPDNTSLSERLLTLKSAYKASDIFLFKYLFTVGMQEQPQLTNSNKKYVQNNTNNKLDTVVKLIYLQIKNPQSILSTFLTLVLNSNNAILNLMAAARLFHTREPRK